MEVLSLQNCEGKIMQEFQNGEVVGCKQKIPLDFHGGFSIGFYHSCSMNELGKFIAD